MAKIRIFDPRVLIAPIKNALADPHGIGRIELLIEESRKEDRHIFYDMPANALCIDCGVNKGWTSDAILLLGGRVIGFEANPTAANFLSRKYTNNKNIEIHASAVSHKNGTANFTRQHGDPFDLGGNIVAWKHSEKAKYETYQVPLVRLSEKILELKEDVYLLKLDVEGAEFDIIPDLIESGAYKKCKHIVCETHARFFPDGKKRLEAINTLIKNNGITNINLEWW